MTDEEAPAPLNARWTRKLWASGRFQRRNLSLTRTSYRQLIEMINAG